jgi:predicted transcriptional regulator of viral defense system
MKFRDFESKIADLPVFNLNDVRKIDPAFHRQQLSYWQEHGYIIAFAGGYYVLANRSFNESYLFMAANKLYQPSYISLESALAYYQVIPESVLSITSISSRKTKQYNTDWGVFSYRSVKPQYIFGYQVVEISQRIKYSIASIEKAVLDYLYLNADIHAIAAFEGLRWNKNQLQFLNDSLEFQEYLTIFESKALRRRVEKFMEYLNA